MTIDKQILEDAKDAKRYRFLKARYAMANFDIYESEFKEQRVCGIIFEMPNHTRFSADVDATIDSVIEGVK